MEYATLTAIDSTASGTRRPGLTPAIVYAKRLSDLADVSASVDEIGNGDYRVSYDAVANGPASIQVDLDNGGAGANLPFAGDRFQTTSVVADAFFAVRQLFPERLTFRVGQTTPAVALPLVRNGINAGLPFYYSSDGNHILGYSKGVGKFVILYQQMQGALDSPPDDRWEADNLFEQFNPVGAYSGGGFLEPVGDETGQVGLPDALWIFDPDNALGFGAEWPAYLTSNKQNGLPTYAGTQPLPYTIGVFNGVWTIGSSAPNQSNNNNPCGSYGNNIVVSSLTAAAPVNVTVGGYATGQDPATLLASLFNTVNANVALVSTNSRQCTVVIPGEFYIPAAGNSIFWVDVFINDVDQNPLDPDSNTITVHAYLMNGTSMDTRLTDSNGSNPGTTALTRIAQGHYRAYIQVLSTDSEQPVAFTGNYAVSSVTKNFGGVVDLLDLTPAATLAQIATAVGGGTAGQAGGLAVQAQAGTVQSDAAAALTGYDSGNGVAKQSTLSSLASCATPGFVNVATILGKFTGITYLAKWLSLIMGSAADGTTLTEVQQQTASANFSNTIMSEQALAGRLGTTPINVISFIVAGGVLQLNRGDDYLNSDGRAIPFNNPGNGPDLTSATVYLEVRRIADGQIVFSVAGTIVGPPSAWTQIYFEPRAAQTSQLLQINQRAYEYKVLATWPALNPVKNETLVQVSPVVVKW